MSRILSVNATDPRITNFGEWARNDTALVCTPWNCEFFFMFRGTGIKMYGQAHTLVMLMTLDGNTTTISLNDTAFADGVTEMYRVENLDDGDHQLLGSVVPSSNGSFLMDHFEIEISSGNSFDPLSAGPIAQHVPAQAVIVDNIDPAIVYHNQSLWSIPAPGTIDVSNYGVLVSWTSTAGASLSFSFDGVAIWYYGPLCGWCAAFKVSIDGSTPQRLNTNYSGAAGQLDQQMIWSNTNLDPGRHTITLTHDDPAIRNFYLDFFRVLTVPVTSTQLSSISTTTLGELPTTGPQVASTNQNQTNMVGLAVGLTLGLLVFVAVVLCGVRRIYRRRGRRPIGPDALSIFPFIGSLIRPADQQLSIPQHLQGVPQPAQPSQPFQPSQPAWPYGAPMATVEKSIFSSETVLEPPPSYETLSYDWRVDTAQ